MEFAIAPCCWGVYWPNGNTLSWDDYLAKIAVAGYRATELGPYGFGPTSHEGLRTSLERHDLKLVAAAHVHTLADETSWPVLERKAHQIAALLAELGGGQLILMDESEFYPKDRMGVVTPDQWATLVHQVAAAAEITRQYRLSFAFHPHVGTCVETEDQIERLLRETDPALVGLCLDTGHHAYWNADPLAFLRRHRHRLASVHLKNTDGAVLERVHRDGIHCDKAFEIGVMTDLESGSVNIRAVVADLMENDFAGPVVVEQDYASADPRSPEAIAADNLQFLIDVRRDRPG